jgi:hypothetical protein
MMNIGSVLVATTHAKEIETKNVVGFNILAGREFRKCNGCFQ